MRPSPLCRLRPKTSAGVGRLQLPLVCVPPVLADIDDSHCPIACVAHLAGESFARPWADAGSSGQSLVLDPANSYAGPIGPLVIIDLFQQPVSIDRPRIGVTPQGAVACRPMGALVVEGEQ